jgi:hypothetical protein
MGPISCPETPVRNYHYSLRNSPEERTYHLLRGGVLKSRMIISFLKNARQLYLAGKRTELDEGGERILLGDNTDSRVLEFRFQMTTVWIFKSDLRKI